MSWILVYLCIVTVLLSSTSKTYEKNFKLVWLDLKNLYHQYYDDII